MTVDITIGKRQESAPVVPCRASGFANDCPGRTCRECLRLVQEEERPDAPPIDSATAAGVRKAGFNFTQVPIHFYFRWLEETGLSNEYPFLNIPSNDPIAHPIPDGMGMRLHQLAVQIELGQVVTKYPEVDAEFTCWFAWWCIAAVKSYGLLAAIETH